MENLDDFAEKSVLGCVILYEEKAGEVVNELSAEMFPDPLDQRVFEKINELYWGKRALDPVTLIGELPELREHILTLAQIPPLPDHLPDYIRIVQDKWQTRKLLETLDAIRYGGGDLDSLLERTEEAVREHRKLLLVRKDLGVSSFGEVFQKFLQWLNQEQDQSRLTGFRELDSFTGGCREGTMLTLAARPGGGKTDFALNLSLHLAKRGVKVLYFTMEMSDVDLMRRAVSHMLRINSVRIRDRQLTGEERKAVEELTGHLHQWGKLSFVYEGGLSLESVRRRVELHRPQVVVVDHIGLMKRPKAPNAYRELGLLSNRLKQLALDEGICVVALSQMNRQIESRKGGEANMSDLRESGDLEQDSDFVGFLQPQIVKGKRLSGQDSMDSFLQVKKSREGQMEGRILYHWQPQYHRFMEVEGRFGE